MSPTDYLLAKEELDSSLIGHVENVQKISRKAQLESYDNCARLRPVWDEIASKYDAVLTPSVVDEAPVGILDTGSAAFCSMWTILQVPCLNVPGFKGENGLPIGLTIVGPRYWDLHVLHAGQKIGECFEKEGGFVNKLI
jgi:Asp-tRNA(Asn)/Glu-tRNA(Gln) amidotransferase A subunit family amidase